MNSINQNDPEVESGIHATQEVENNNPAITDTEQVSLTEEQQAAIVQELLKEQNFKLALAAGLVCAVLCGIIWAAITVASGYQIGYMALAVGFVIGYTIRFTGKGIDKKFGYLGAGLALFACFLGNFFSIAAYFANYAEMGYLEVYTVLDLSAVPEVMMETFSPIDLLFYGIALYEGYRFSFRTVSVEDMMNSAAVIGK